MAKRKRTQTQAQRKPGDADYNPSASKLKYSSYADIADSEDEFHINRDKILVDEAPEAKRRKQLEDDFLEPSDEEVLAYSEDDSEAEDVASDDEMVDDLGAEDDEVISRDSADDREAQDGDEINEWGASKADYYNTDVIETEQDALEEEAEARRLQQKRLKALKEADFGFDETEWAGAGEEGEEEVEDGMIIEVLPQLQVTEAMSPTERLKLLKARYPEFEPLAKQLLELQPLHEELLGVARAAQKAQQVAEGLSSSAEISVQLLKFHALSAYLGALSMYFVVLTSTANDDKTQSLPLPPHVLQNHGVMDSLVRSRENWEMVKDLEDVDIPTVLTNVAEEIPVSSLPDVKVDEKQERNISDSGKSSRTQDSTPETRSSAETTASKARRAERLRRTEESLAALSNITNTVTRRQRPAVTASTSLTATRHSDIDSDFGDEPTLAPHEAAEKARRKKSLRFYTSQIAQRANKRANAGRAAGGDDDVPYRERLRDRQDRLIREAENRGKKGKRGNDGTELNGHDSDGEAEVTNRQREQRGGSEDAYADALEARVLAKKATKQARADAYAEAKETGGRVVRYEDAGVGPDGRREVGYAIEKNKGLMPRRKKDVKNPRVKKRKKFEEKTKKLHSMKAVYKGGEGRGGYAGELTGIKKGLVRSVKF